MSCRLLANAIIALHLAFIACVVADGVLMRVDHRWVWAAVGEFAL